MTGHATAERASINQLTRAVSCVDIAKDVKRQAVDKIAASLLDGQLAAFPQGPKICHRRCLGRNSDIYRNPLVQPQRPREVCGVSSQQNAHRAFPQVGDAQSPARGLVARGGVEPPTFRFSVGRSYQLSYLAVMALGGPDGT
jgi:hypothetical protein